MRRESRLQLSDLITSIGEAGRRICEISASEGTTGNISCCCTEELSLAQAFPNEEPLTLVCPVPALAGATLVVTGSGRRLREIGDNPEGNLGAVTISQDGKSAALHTSPRRLFDRLTIEFNSHLAVHQDWMARNGGHFSALVHAQPVHLTYLSHIPRYRDEKYLSQHVLRWMPESIYHMSAGVGVIPFAVSGSDEMERANVESLRTHAIVLWCKHGVMARSDASVKKACDMVEYAETGALYECLNLARGEVGEGLSREEILRICDTFGIQQSVF